MTDEMTQEQVDAFLRETRIGSFSTVDGKGQPVTVPVWFEWDGGVVRLFSGKDTAKVRRLDKHAAAALTVYEGVGKPEAWVSVEGGSTITTDGVMDLIARLARRYYAPERAERILEQWMEAGPAFVMITIEPERIRSYQTEW